VPRRGERIRIREAVEQAIAGCGLEDLAGRRVAGLSTGQRRMVELAGPRPASSAWFCWTSRRRASIRWKAIGWRRSSALGGRPRPGVLLVEHDMSVVMAICDYLYSSTSAS